jgi:hypothetical protein
MGAGFVPIRGEPQASRDVPEDLANRLPRKARHGGEAGIRTLGRVLKPYNGLANRRLKPLGHLTLRLAALAQGEPQVSVAHDIIANPRSATLLD